MVSTTHIMGREVRITIDDDEVFERMKRRKGELDLSWEEVLHRGLRRDSELGVEADPEPGTGPQRRRDAHRHHGRPAEERRTDRPSGGRGDRWDTFAESIESEIQNKVYDTLQSSFGAAGLDVPERETLGEDVDELERAEDATLVFEFLDDQPEYRVPLRVNLRTSPDGIDVEVVAVREGKNVRHTNRFDGETRQQVNTRLASGESATLRFEGGEEYGVRPVLTWSRDGDAARVSAVEIDEVVLDER